MPLDDGYTPDPIRPAPAYEPRIMMLEDLDPAEQRMVKKAINRRKSKTDTSEAGPVLIDNHWWNTWEGARRDFQVSAEKAAETSGNPQRIHHHAHGEPCDGFEHEDIFPTSTRAAALRR